MKHTFNVRQFWRASLAQDASKMRQYFHPEAVVNWHNTNEHFTAEEFIRANCMYPGKWDGEVERTEDMGGIIITVTHVYSLEDTLSFHAVSFIRLKEDKIISIDEYWGDDGEAPQWRLDQHIGCPIK